MSSRAATVRRLAPVAAIVAAAVVLVLVLTAGGGTYTLKATFANVNGLVTTGKVEVAGFKVGEITGISVRMGGYPEVTMQVSDSYRVRRGAHAVIELGSLAGQLNRYIALSGGTGAELPDGSTIPLSHTGSPVEIDQFLSALDPRTRTELRRLLREAVHTLNGRGPDIEQALRYSTTAFEQTAGLLDDVSADGPALRTLVRRASQGAHALATEPADVADTVNRLGQLLQIAADRQRQLSQSLSRLPAALDATNRALETFGSSIPSFEHLTDLATPALNAIDPFARALRAVAPKSVPVLRSALSLIEAFRTGSPAIRALFAAPLPQTLHNLFVGLRGVNPLFDQLRARAPDVLGWIPLLGDATANYNANGHGALVLAYPRPAVQQPIETPSCRDGWLLRPFDRIPGQLACDPWLGYARSFVGGGRPDSAYGPQHAYPGEFGG